FVAAIAVNHSIEAGRSLAKNDFIVKLNPPRPQMIPSWDLSTALKGPPFELLTSADLWPLSLKMALLLALQALSVSASCLEFGPNDCKVVLKPRHGYVPK
ncbi:hypothetical protein M9458_047159, partial [Cirrhinus mrigala]